MIANYGYEDGSGVYYISLDTDKCATCKDRACLSGCPVGVFELEADDWDEVVAVVEKDKRNNIRYICSVCKSMDNRREILPCQASCKLQAILHSW